MTRKAYIKVCIQLFNYLVRAMTLEQGEDRPPFVLRERQKAAYEAMMDSVDHLTNVGDEEDEAMPSGRRLYQELDNAVMEM